MARTESGKLSVSPAKPRETEMSSAFLLSADSFGFDDRPAVARYVVRAFLYSFVPALSVAAILNHLVPGIFELATPYRSGTPLDSFAVVMLAPLVETALMFPIIAILQRLLGTKWLIVALSATLWALLHGLVNVGWGLITFWPFVVFSSAFLAWRRHGIWPTFAITASIHILHNLASVALE